MQYRTHLTTSLAVSLPIMVQTDTVSIGNVLALSLGALLPDIDEPHSWIGARTRGFSDIINLIFGHRGITHSLIALTTVLLTMLLIHVTMGLNIMTGLYFVIGYALHLIEDSFSKSGVKWLLPIYNKNIQFGNGGFYYTTGGFIENMIFLASAMILIAEVYFLDISIISDFNFNFPNLVNGISDFVLKIKDLII